MAGQFDVFNASHDGPTTHAVIIGVGDYPHLLGGNGPLTPVHDGMGQLTSPPASARAFAHWLLKEFHNPECPLGTVQLLLSEQDESTFQPPDGSPAIEVERASFENIEEAINEWRERADTHLDNMTIFYFCGHGISEGNAMVLMPSDFGSEDNAFKHSIDFQNIYESMEQYKAKRQCYFVDACRASSDALAMNAGARILQNNPRRVEGTRLGPVYYATLKTEKSHGVPGQPSWFTSALIESLTHFGADKREGDWRVTNRGLNLAIDHLMKSLYHTGIERAQTPDNTGVIDTFPVSYLKRDPHAILYLSGNPSIRFNASKVKCTDPAGMHIERDPVLPANEDPGDWWIVRVTAGPSKVEVFDPTNAVAPIADEQVEVTPPYQRLTLALQ